MRTVTDPDVAAGYAVDSSLGAVAPATFEVVRARDRADVVEVLREAAATRRPVVPQGARTGLAGGAVATEGSLVLNVEGLDQIEELDELERFAVVGPASSTRRSRPPPRRSDSRTHPTRHRPRAARSAGTSRPTRAASAA